MPSTFNGDGLAVPRRSVTALPRRSFVRFFRILMFAAALIGCAENITLNDGERVEDEGGGKAPSIEDSNGISARSMRIAGESELGYRGVDILLVVDSFYRGDIENAAVNSDWYRRVEQRLATEIYALITGLMHPLGDEPVVEQLRVGLVTSRMGVQYGALMGDGVPEVLDGTLPDLPGCDPLGDNGILQSKALSTTAVNIENGRIPCRYYGAQCPEHWACGESGHCEAYNFETWLMCGDSGGDILTDGGAISTAPALDAACLVRRETDSCPIDQPLEAMTKALNRRRDFLVPSHILSVFQLSYRDDCSIENPDIFISEAWRNDFQLDNGRTRCFDGNNRDYLFDTERYVADLRAQKGGNRAAVFFNAIVGAPIDCTGTGEETARGGCLERDAMVGAPRVYSGVETDYFDFEPACRISQSEGDDSGPRPGRRLVDVAIQFGDNGYVQSMCDPSWLGMTDRQLWHIRNLLAFDGCRIEDPLATEPSPTDCPDCRRSQCDLYVEFVRGGSQSMDLTCPDGLRFGADYMKKAGHTGTPGQGEIRVYCPVQNIGVPIDCRSAGAVVPQDAAAWYFCQNSEASEGSEFTCSDGIDNNGVGGTDCDDSGCEACSVCGGAGDGCLLGCPYDISLTSTAKQIVQDNVLYLDCPFPFV